MKSLKFFILLPLLGVMSCGGNSSKEALSVRVDDKFTALYMPASGGVTSADGTISIALDDGSSLFMTGDCFVGDVIGEKQRTQNEKMINNSLVHISSDHKYLGAHYLGTQAEPFSLCTPPEAAESPVNYWYWPGHGFQRGNVLYCFMTKFYQGGEGQWGFRFDGTDIVQIDLKDYSVKSIEQIYDGQNPVHWGHCVMKAGDYYYVYGTRSGADQAQLCVSRAEFDEVSGSLGTYEYFDGRSWSSDPDAVAACGGLNVSVSEQFSIFEYEDTYVLLTQRRGQRAGEIYSFISDTPQGPWRNKRQLYVTQEQNEDSDLFTYNAMAHPQFINDQQELLICYNVNSYDVQRLFDDVNTYRPVFLRVPMEMILK
jgi:hypothetical protein